MHTEPIYNIGNVLQSKYETPGKRKYVVAETIVQRCSGGTQIFYFCETFADTNSNDPFLRRHKSDDPPLAPNWVQSFPPNWQQGQPTWIRIREDMVEPFGITHV